MLSSSPAKPDKKRTVFLRLCRKKICFLFVTTHNTRGAVSRTEKLRESVKLSDDGDEDYGEELVFFLLPDFTPECSGYIYTLDAIVFRSRSSIRADIYVGILRTL